MPLLTDMMSRDMPRQFYKFQFQIYSGLFLIGIMGFLYLTSPAINRRTYLSENALSPGLVTSDLSLSVDYTRHIMGQLRTAFKSDNVTDAIRAMLLDNGIEAYKQDIGLNSTRTSSQQAENVYGIVRAPRTASTESIILVAPLRVRTQENQLRANIFGIAHTLAISFALRRKPYMAKDIILLFPAAQEFGVRAWLNAYFNTDPHSAPLEAHAGSIQAGLALEFPHEKFYSFDLRHNGINGQLPNLDLINTIIQLSDKNSISVSLYSIYVDLSSNEAWLDYILKSLRTLLLNVLTLATGVPDGIHGQFLHYRIEMVTLFGSLDKHHDYQHSPITMRAFDDVIEGFIRSLNNLLERFHQSFFFYLLINRRTFVSIATYMIPLGIVVLPALLRSFVLHMSFFASTSSSSANQIATQGRTLKFLVHYSPLFRELIECLALSYAFSWVPLKLPLLVVCLVTMYLSPVLLSPLRSNEPHFDYFQFGLLLAGSALLACLSLLNYSMAFLVACFLMPCYFVAGCSKFDHWFIKASARFLFIIVLNPLVFLVGYYYLARVLLTGNLFAFNLVQFSNDLDAYSASYRLFNAWTVDVVCLMVVPLWLLLYRSTFWIRI